MESLCSLQQMLTSGVKAKVNYIDLVIITIHYYLPNFMVLYNVNETYGLISTEKTALPHPVMHA